MEIAGDKKLLISIAILTLFGLIMVLDSSASFSTGLFGKYHYFILQCIWVGAGTATAFVLYFVDYHRLQKISPLILVITIGLLVLVLVKGDEINGARRWIDLGLFNFQPSELAKIAIILYLSSWLSKPIKMGKDIRNRMKHRITIQIIPFLLVIGLVSGLVVIGEDLGTGEIILSTSIIIFFLAGNDFIQTLETILLLIGSFVAGILAIFTQSYRIKRLLTFTNYNVNVKGQSYQIHQILITLSQGGLFGQGFTHAIQNSQYLVDTTAVTDSIFAVIAEEWGYVGCIILFLVFAFVIYRGFRIAYLAPDKQGQLLAAGITVWICVQFFLNIGANIVLVPLTGVPLPFISYGGSAIITMLAAVGILLNISKHSR